MRHLLALFAVLLLSFGCVSTGLGSENGYDSPMAADSYEGSSYALKSISGTGSAQYLTKESYVKLKVGHGQLEDKFSKIRGNLSAQGAQLTNINYNEYSDRKQYTATVKVAPAKFDSINDMLKGFGEVKDMSLTLEDVTKEYTDLETRISNKENELSRLNQLYNQSESVSEILEVEKELTRVETELELLKWQRDNLSSRISKSTISVTVYEEKPATEGLSLQLENLAGLFFGAIAAAITLIVVAVGFLIPVGILVGIVWKAYKYATRPRKPSPSRSRPRQ